MLTYAQAETQNSEFPPTEPKARPMTTMTTSLEPFISLAHEQSSNYNREAIEGFIKSWENSGGNEDAHSKPFWRDLFKLLGLASLQDKGVITFEHNVYFPGESHPKRIDVYREGCFLIEAKQGSNKSKGHARGHGERGTRPYEVEMRKAFGQATAYADNLDVARPPVLMVVDVGWRFDVWTGYAGVYGGYEARHSIDLQDLRNPDVFSLLEDWLVAPARRDPNHVAAYVTKDVAGKLAKLAVVLEDKGENPQDVAKFLMQCLFTMFVEDIGFLGPHLFEKYLEDHWLKDPSTFKNGVEELWQRMDKGFNDKISGVDILQFNGALFKNAKAFDLEREEVALLFETARADWSRVEPSIFGTLLERALTPSERHRLGAHYTPRAYIERLLRPTLEQPLREMWEGVQAEVQHLLGDEKGSQRAAKAKDKAIAAVLAFKQHLAKIQILDPACGSGNFLYVALDLLKQLEVEVDRLLDDLGHTQQSLGLMGVTVTPSQFHGIEIKPWAREIAEVVLWIGALQWYRRRYPNALPPEPVLQSHEQIIRGDAIMQWKSKTARLDKNGVPVMLWDQVTRKTNAAGVSVPDEKALVQVYDYSGTSKTPWPNVDYIIGNPPFIGPAPMRQTLGTGYVEALRTLYKDVPESCDYVMYWWHRAAEMLLDEDLKLIRFGLITTNSITQKFARRVVKKAMDAKPALSLRFAVPDHPWVDASDGADVRIAMTVAALDEEDVDGDLWRVSLEKKTKRGFAETEFAVERGVIHEDLRVGANVASALPLNAMTGLISAGMKLHGKGFRLNVKQYEELRVEINDDAIFKTYVHPYLGGSDLTKVPKKQWVIDLYGHDLADVRTQASPLVQWIERHVKPDRDVNRREKYRSFWWLFGEPRESLRQALEGLDRYIATTETSKHRFFQFLEGDIVPDNMITAIASDDGYVLGILSSRVHIVWSLAAGGRQGVGNDPRYTKTRCFDPFPFPTPDDDLVQKIREKAEELEDHRRSVQVKDPKLLTMTNMYNVLERIRAIDAGEDPTPLSKKETRIMNGGEIDTRLQALHDELDQLVFDAYGLSLYEVDENDQLLIDEDGKPVPISDASILTHIVKLNALRIAEEKSGLVRWLRPDFQNPNGQEEKEASQDMLALDIDDLEDTPFVEVPFPEDAQERARLLKRRVKEHPGCVLEDFYAMFSSRMTKNRKKLVAQTLEALATTGTIVQVNNSQWY